MNANIGQSTTCKNCNTIFHGQYCNVCGQKLINRFTLSFLWQGFHKDIFEVDNGLLLTYRDMWVRPGTMVLEYISGATKKYYSPLKYLIFWTALYLIIQPFIAKEDIDRMEEHSITSLMLNSHSPFSRDSLLFLALRNCTSEPIFCFQSDSCFIKISFASS